MYTLYLPYYIYPPLTLLLLFTSTLHSHFSSAIKAKQEH